jgi:hypothetical protein
MKTIILIIGFFLAVSCNSDDTSSSAQSTPVNFTEIGKGALYGNGSEGITQSNMVITNDADWQNLIYQMNSVNNVTNEFSESNIDFGSYVIVAVFLEVKQHGWELEISNIEETTSNIVVSKIETALINSVITQPFHIVKIPITTKPIEFEN